ESRRSSPVAMRRVAPSTFHRVTSQLTTAPPATTTTSARSHQRLPAPVPISPEEDSPARASTASTARPERTSGDSGCSRRQPSSVVIASLAGRRAGGTRGGSGGRPPGPALFDAGTPQGRTGHAAFGPAAAERLPPNPSQARGLGFAQGGQAVAQPRRLVTLQPRDPGVAGRGGRVQLHRG